MVFVSIQEALECSKDKLYTESMRSSVTTGKVRSSGKRPAPQKQVERNLTATSQSSVIPCYMMLYAIKPRFSRVC